MRNAAFQLPATSRTSPAFAASASGSARTSLPPDPPTLCGLTGNPANFAITPRMAALSLSNTGSSNHVRLNPGRAASARAVCNRMSLRSAGV
ncbi:MAG TPA: hypothetical protein VM529_23370, partial [Gemmata sp.]|nr:hypothetical protein [Gemmata sp.]